jgi:hypothetical protein
LEEGQLVLDSRTRSEVGGHRPQVRRKAVSRLYYIQTTKGVFRVSRIAREIVEV